MTWFVNVNVDGTWVHAHFDQEPGEEDLEAFRELIRAARRKWASEGNREGKS